MGYKLAGFDVIGCNEIDPKMMFAYQTNHSPKYAFLESIATLKERSDLPKCLYDLDILDGSPPCSSFSSVGVRERDWGKEKKFKEGQVAQVLDRLFFDFIDLANELKPKVVIAENVEGILLGKAKKYVFEIYEAFERAGYALQHFTLDSSKMGVPQSRKRVFFIGIRKDLSSQFLYQKNLFDKVPKLDLRFNEPIIPFRDIAFDDTGDPFNWQVSDIWDRIEFGDFGKHHHKGHYFGTIKVNPNKPCPTITACSGNALLDFREKRFLSKKQILQAGSFPLDYEFCKLPFRYLVGMSVPPVMIAQIAKRVYDQWLSKI